MYFYLLFLFVYIFFCFSYLVQIAHYLKNYLFYYYYFIFYFNYKTVCKFGLNMATVFSMVGNNVYITVVANKKSLLFLFTGVVNLRSMVSMTGRNVIV